MDWNQKKVIKKIVNFAQETVHDDLRGAKDEYEIEQKRVKLEYANKQNELRLVNGKLLWYRTQSSHTKTIGTNFQLCYS